MVQTGIRHRMTIPGIVPEIDERDAARFSGYTWSEWDALPYDERAGAVAYHRVSRLIEMHVNEAVIESSRPRAGAKARR